MNIDKTLDELQKKFISNPESLQPLIDKAPYAVFIVDKNKNILFFNKKAEEITGYNKKEAINNLCIISRHCTTCGNECAMFDSFTTKDKCIKEVGFLRKNNKEIVIEKSSYPILNPYGEPIAAIEFFIDKTVQINTQKKMESIMQKLDSTNYFNNLLSNLVIEGIIKIEKNNVISLYSKKAETLIGLNKDLVEGKEANKVFKEENWNNILNIINSHNNSSSELNFINLTINNRDLDFAIVPLKDKDNNYESTIIFVKLSLKKMSIDNLTDNSKVKYYDMISKSIKMKKIFNLIENLKNSSVNVLIEGKSGTGKELIAKALFETNQNHNKVFQTINCATLSPDLLESELFGHQKGSFTGAIADKEGKFKLADGGTIFLDEIGEIPMNLQAKLLRVLQFKEFDPVGSTKSIKINVRIIAATNRNLQEAILEGRFREDLYYRLKVVPIYLPNLNERKEDIPILIDFFINKLNKEHASNRKVSENAKIFLMNYDWPGNIRELENLISYLFVVTNKEIIDINDLPDYLINLSKELTYKTNYHKSEKDIILEHLEMFEYNQNKTAQSLGIHRTTLWRKMKRYGIEPYKI